MSKILVVEDDETLSKSLEKLVASDGFQVEVVSTLKAAAQKNLQGFDLILLDWMLPDGQGIDYLKNLRKQGSRIPVIFLTARADLVDKVLGLEMGASDYVTKPFEPRELLARIRVRLSERASHIEERTSSVEIQITVGQLSIDRVRHKVCFRQKEIELVKKEFDLLVLLAEEPEKIFSRDEILNKVWGYEVYPTTRTVDTHVMLLRQKIDADIVETVRSVGYRLKKL